MEFSQFYFEESLLSDLRRAFTSNIFKKRVIGIHVDRLKYLSKLNDKAYYDIDNYLSKDYTKTQKAIDRLYREKDNTNKSLNKELGKIFIKGLYSGEIDDKATKLDPYTKIKSIAVYEASNGGQIVLIIAETNNDKIDRYIGLKNERSNDYFKKVTGRTFQQFTADTHSKTISDEENYDDIADIMPQDNDLDDLDVPEPAKIDTRKEIGLLDITENEYDRFVDYWGNGIKGGYVKMGKGQGDVYKFRGTFTRENFYNNLGNGYKYISRIKKEIIYLIKFDIKNNGGLIIFNDRNSYNWAYNLGMLSVWRSQSQLTRNDGNKVSWIKADVNNLPK